MDPTSYRVHIWCGKTRMAGLQSGEGRMMSNSVVRARRHSSSRPNALCRAAKRIARQCFSPTLAVNAGGVNLAVDFRIVLPTTSPHIHSHGTTRDP